MSTRLLSFQDNHDIETLDLEGNWVEKEGVKYLSDMLRENIYLTDVVSTMFPTNSTII